MGADLSSAAIIRELELEPHPEGGFYHQTFRDKAGGERGHSTAIYYLLEKGTRSHWHRPPMRWRSGTIMPALRSPCIFPKMAGRYRPLPSAPTFWKASARR